MENNNYHDLQDRSDQKFYFYSKKHSYKPKINYTPRFSPLIFRCNLRNLGYSHGKFIFTPSPTIDVIRCLFCIKNFNITNGILRK